MQKQVLCGVMAIVVGGCGTATPTPSPGPITTALTGPGVPPSTVTASAAPSVASATAAPTPSASQAVAAWHSVGPTTGLGGADDIYVVDWFNDRWVAFGDTTDGAATWSSADGIVWHRGTIHSIGPADTPVHVAAMASIGGVAVAVGSWKEQSSASVDVPLAEAGPGTELVSSAMQHGGTPQVIPASTCEGLASADAAVLTSTDGLIWTQVPDSKALHGQPMLGVAALNGGLVAAGGVDGSARSASWTSPDGRHWTRGPDSKALRAGWIDSVVAFGESVIAVGGSACSNAVGVPRAWRSTDGRSWTLAAGVIKGSCCGAAEAVAANGTIAVADGVAGSHGEADVGSATWTTDDGSRWTLHLQTDQPDQSWIGPIVGTTGGFLATGEGVWSSPDGVTWKNEVSEDQNFVAIAVGPNGALAVDGPDIWTGPAVVSTR